MELRCRRSPLYLYSILYAYHEVGILKWQRFGSFFHRPRTKLRGRHFILTHGFNADTLKTQKEKKTSLKPIQVGSSHLLSTRQTCKGPRAPAGGLPWRLGTTVDISKNTADTSRTPGARFPGSPSSSPGTAVLYQLSH